MKPKLFLTLCFLLGAFTACVKSANNNTRQIKVPSKITWISDDANFNYTQNFRYDEQGRMTSIERGDYLSRYYYSRTDFVGVSNFYRGEETFRYGITYANGLPQKLTSGSPTSSSRSVFTYTTNGNRVTAMTDEHNDAVEFRYSGNNVSKVTEDNSTINTFLYSSLKSPFYNVRLKYIFFNVGYDYGANDFFCENAVSQSTQQISWLGLVVKYNYTADVDNFPASAIANFSYSDGKKSAATVSYEYKMIEASN